MYSLSRSLLRSAPRAARQNFLLPVSARQNAYSTSQTPPPIEQELNGEQRIQSMLTERFNPSRLQVEDVSGGCGTFYAITIASKAFAGIPTVKQHRLVNETLKEVISGIHGLQVRAAVQYTIYTQDEID
ncbi:hypothetical protein M0805_005413 [Coniferiporia weirii]|nr:hypothetical protein M0805_005413 [Coniferiporia weirii]